MRRFVKKIVIVLIIAGAAYILYSSIEKIGKNRVGIVEDIRNKLIVRTYRPLFRDYAFVWQGALPWRFSLAEIPLRRIVSHEIKIPIPALSGLVEDYYFIRVPIRVVYRIDMKRFSDNSLLGDNCRGLDTQVGRLFDDALINECGKYIAPAYQRDLLAAQVAPMVRKIDIELQPELKEMGLSPVSVAVSGTVWLPELAAYYEGMQHAAEMRRLNRSLQRDMLEMRGKMDREKIKNEQFYARLLEISKIISNNPDMLRYIYIDKLAGNVKLILSSDNSGLPGFLESAKKQTKGAPRDIDNLR